MAALHLALGDLDCGGLPWMIAPFSGLDWAGGCWLQCQQPLHCAFIQVIKKVGGVSGTGCKGEFDYSC